MHQILAVISPGGRMREAGLLCGRQYQLSHLLVAEVPSLGFR